MGVLWPLVRYPPGRLHYHVWRMARNGRIYYRMEPFFLSEAEAEQWQNRKDPDGTREFMVLECELSFCGPVR